MRNILTAVAAIVAVCHLSAAPVKLYDLYRKGDYAGVEASATAMQKEARSDAQKGTVLSYVSLARQKQGKYADTAAAFADIEALAKTLGFASNHDQVQSAKLQILQAKKEHASALELSSGWTGPRTLARRAASLRALGRYAESAALFASSGYANCHFQAAISARLAKMPEKVYEYSLTAFANGEVKDPAAAIRLVNAVIDADYTGTAVTAAKVKELLQTVNRKYSRRLVVGQPSKWDELIQLVRQTLETY